MPKAAVIFDLDGVIVDSEELQYRAYRAILLRYDVSVSRAEYGREWIANGNGPEYAVRAYSLETTPERLRGEKNPLYHALLRREARLMPGAHEAVIRLASDFPLALATNSNEADTGFVLDHFGLRRYFTAVVTRGLYRDSKPAPDAFLTASRSLGSPPECCVVIEDAFKGIVAARKAGCPCIAIPHDLTRDNDFALADAVIDSLDDVTTDLVCSLIAGGHQRIGDGRRDSC